MFMRFVQLRIREDAVEAFRRFYAYRVSPALLGVPGCLFARLIQKDADPTDMISMTLWDSSKMAEEYESSGFYQELIAENEPFTEDSTEWKIRLTEDMKLEYGPVKDEPTVEGMEVLAGSTEIDPDTGISPHTYVRIVSLKIMPDQFEEFKQRYNALIVPELLKVAGCRAAYFVGMEDEGSGISITVWDAKEQADAYETSGRYRQLFSIIEPLLSSLYQWKMSLDPGKKDRTRTSDDVSVEGYHTVSGETLDPSHLETGSGE